MLVPLTNELLLSKTLSKTYKDKKYRSLSNQFPKIKKELK
jgi:hypothetical protein